MGNPLVETFARAYFPLIEELKNNMSGLGISTPLPSFDQADISKLLDETRATYPDPEAIIELDGDIYIIGDIHGNFFDLLRMFAVIENPLDQNYLFLGDFVDRGSFSLDVVLFLFTLRCKFPKQVHFIRGNHEFRDLNEMYGFKEEIMSRFESADLWDQINRVFEYLPFVAIVNKENFCVHGGIGPSTNIDKIKAIDFPVPKWQSGLIMDLVWSDPGHKISHFLQSERGLGALFGRLQLIQFLKATEMKRMIRGHQCVNGVHVKWNGILITVFSSSNYSDYQNPAGILYIDSSGAMSDTILPEIAWRTRGEVRFRKVVARTDNWKPMTFMLNPIGRPVIGRNHLKKTECQRSSSLRNLGSMSYTRKRTNSYGNLPSLFSSPRKEVSLLEPLPALQDEQIEGIEFR